MTFSDIKGTSLENMLRALYVNDSIFEDDDEVCTVLADIALSDYPADYFYASLTLDGINCFGTEEAYRSSIERDWADVYWEEMDDDLLATWIERLNNEGLL